MNKLAYTSLIAMAWAPPVIAQNAGASDQEQASEVVVTASRYTMSTLGIPTPVLEVPRALDVVAREDWEDRNVTHPNEALRLTSGFDQSGTYGGFRPAFSLRSFGVGRILDDGFNVIGSSGARTSELAAFSRIEVLKGPAGAEYGNISSGGIINFLSRMPGDSEALELSAQLDTNGQRRAVVDADLGEATDNVAFRTVAAYENSDSFRDLLSRESVFIAPSLTWTPSSDTRINFVARHQSATGVFDQMFPNSPLVLDLPIERFFGEATDEADFRTSLARAWVEHTLSENLTLRLGANHSQTSYVNSFWSPRGNVNVANRTFEQAAVREKNTIDETALQGNLRGNFTFIPGLESNFLFAMEAQTEKVRPMSQSGSQLSVNSLDNPLRNRVFPAIADAFRTEKQRWIAVTVQQQQTWRDVLTFNTGIRVDSSEVTRLDERTGLYRENDYSEASPFIGLSYRPAPWFSIYGNYATSFTNQIGTQLENSGIPDPLTGRQFEGGIKVGTADERLSGTASVFEITQRNVLTASEIPGISVQTGEIRTRGFEFDLAAQPLDDLQLQLAYTYLDAEVTEDTRIAPGTKLRTNSKHNFNVWAEYGLPFIERLSIGGGVFHVGKKDTRDTGGFELPAYTRFDASLSYDADRWRATLYLENISDERYFYTRGPVLAPQAPFTASLRLATRL